MLVWGWIRHTYNKNSKIKLKKLFYLLIMKKKTFLSFVIRLYLLKKVKKFMLFSLIKFVFFHPWNLWSKIGNGIYMLHYPNNLSKNYQPAGLKSYYRYALRSYMARKFFSESTLRLAMGAGLHQSLRSCNFLAEVPLTPEEQPNSSFPGIVNRVL